MTLEQVADGDVMWPDKVKELAYTLDREAWKSYKGRSRDFRRGIDKRRVGTLQEAKKQLMVNCPGCGCTHYSFVRCRTI